MSREPQSVLDMYGAKPGDGSFASNCLLARRLAGRGVRFIQLYHRDWDHHNNIPANVPLKVEEVDRATAALIQRSRRSAGCSTTRWSSGVAVRARRPMSQSGNGARPSHQGLLVHDGRWRHQAGASPRGDR
jgi:hypothetical protein